MIHVTGMHGLGDNLHERAIVRKLLLRDSVQLETPWPSVFHDLVGPRLRLVHKISGLRTQAKNARREASKYQSLRSSRAPAMRIWYTHDQIRTHGTFLAAMAANSGLSVSVHDIALPIAERWQAKAQHWLDKWKPARPLMLYRPLVERTEWNGCAARNPDHRAYAELARSVRERFFVVSIADLEPGKEWVVGEDIKADVECHRGELEFEVLAALAARAGVVFCSPGFAVILAQAVSAPLVAVFGGHEASRFYDHGLANNLLISPMRPCDCFSKEHACDKRIDMARALDALASFAGAVAV
jgi:hypothetical protein